MSIVVARRKRAALFLSISGLLIMVAAVSAVSARDPDGVSLRVGMVMMTVGAAMWLPWQALLPMAAAFWLGPNYVRSVIDEQPLFGTNMLLELPGMLGLAAFAGFARYSLRGLETETLLLGASNEEMTGLDPETGVYDERMLRPALESELVRARRFNHEFAFVLIGIDSRRQKFDYRDEETWQASFLATARLLRNTRTHIDRAYRYGTSSFALILPESSARDVTGLIRRLRRVARQAVPAEGEPGGPLPTHFGATFFPHAATTTEDLLRRAEVAMRLAEKNSNRVQMDGAEAPDLPPPETLRREGQRPEAAKPAALWPETPAPVEAAKPASPWPETRAPVEALPAELVSEIERPEPAIAFETAGPSAVPADTTSAPVPTPTSEAPISEPRAPAPEPPIERPSPAFVGGVAQNGSAGDPEAIGPIEQPMFAPAAATGDLRAPEATPLLPPSSKATEESAQSQPQPLDEAVSELLKHLDETLEMIRSLRTGSPS